MNTIDFLTKHNKQIILVGDVPHLGVINTYVRRSIATWAPTTNITMDYTFVENTKLDLLAKKYKNVFYLNPKTITQSVVTYPFFNNVLMYRDFGHLNKYWSEMLGSAWVAPRNDDSLVNILKHRRVIL